MEIQSLKPIHFFDLAGAPMFDVSEHGDVCFHSCSEVEKDSTLYIVKANSEVIQTPIPGTQLPVRLDFDVPRIRAPKVTNRYIYVATHSHPYHPDETAHYIQTDLNGRVIWEWTVDGCPMANVVTSQGGQYILYCVRVSDFKTSCELTYLSEYGESLWTIRDKWISHGGSIVLRSDDSVLIAKDSTRGISMRAPRISQIISIDTSGEIAAKMNTLKKMTGYRVGGSLAKTPNYIIGENILFVRENEPFFSLTPDMGYKPRFIPTDVTEFNLINGELRQKKLELGMVRTSLWDEDRRILYVSSIMEENAVVKIDIDNWVVDYHRFKQRQPYYNNFKFLTEPPGASYYVNHCTPVLTIQEDIIFCNSTSSLLCMTPDWKEKWTMLLPEGACDMKVSGNNLYVMCYREDKREAILQRFILL